MNLLQSCLAQRLRNCKPPLEYFNTPKIVPNPAQTGHKQLYQVIMVPEENIDSRTNSEVSEEEIDVEKIRSNHPTTAISFYPRPTNKTERFSNHHELKKYCGDCKKSFATVGSYTRHLRMIHYKLKPLSCRVCRHAFYQRSDLKKHIQRQHPDERIIANSLSQIVIE